MIVLASSSPRRRELLQQIGVPFRVQVQAVDETPLPDELPGDYVARLALEKARAVAALNPGQVVLGADTTGVLDGQILVKPVDDEDARRMLSMMSGRTHEVLTAVAVVQDEQARTVVVTTAVTFCVLSDEQIAAYVATGEPADKAGAYGIQGLGAVLVAGIRGSYSNVVGLPLTEVAALLREFRIPIWQQDSCCEC